MPIKIKTTDKDLEGATLAAAEHFRRVGVNQSTVRAFVLNAREAGLLVGRQGETLILAHGGR